MYSASKVSRVNNPTVIEELTKDDLSRYLYLQKLVSNSIEIIDSKNNEISEKQHRLLDIYQKCLKLKAQKLEDTAQKSENIKSYLSGR